MIDGDDMVHYAHKTAPKGQRFRQFAKDPLPDWAIDVQPCQETVSFTPWSDPHSVWKSKPAYFTWLRGGLRRMWARHPMSIKFKNSKCRPVHPHDPVSHRVKQVGACERCGKVFAKSKLEVDHIEPAGSLQDWGDVGPFVQRLLGCSSASLRLVCKPCHKIITYAERFSCTEDEATIQKKVIAFSKMPAVTQKLILMQFGDYPKSSNAKERRTIYYTHLIQNP